MARGAGSQMMEVRAARKALGVEASMKRVDTCAAEFEAATPYMYSSYDGNCECEPTTARKVPLEALHPTDHMEGGHTERDGRRHFDR